MNQQQYQYTIKLRIMQLKNMVINQEDIDHEQRINDLAKFRNAIKWRNGRESWYVIYTDWYTTITRGIESIDGDKTIIEQWVIGVNGTPEQYRKEVQRWES